MKATVAKSTQHCTDILILGAGPAGCAAAIRARQAGLCVSMFDINPQPKVAPGETLHPGIEPILKQLGILDDILRAGFQRHLGIWIERGGQRYFSAYGEDEDGPWRGFQVDRQIFHQILQRAAIDAGATLIRNAGPDAVLMVGGRVMGVVVDDRHARANWTLDATGRSAWLARKLGFPVIRRSLPLGVRFGWGNHDWRNLDGQPSFMFRDDGWDWQAPLGHKRVAWVKLRIGEKNMRPAGIDLAWRFNPQCAGPGFFLLGDTAATLDPTSSHGVLRALMSGILSGYLMECCVHRSASEIKIASIYRAWLRSSFEHDEKRLRQLYADSPAGERFGRYLFQDKEGCVRRRSVSQTNSPNHLLPEANGDIHVSIHGPGWGQLP